MHVGDIVRDTTTAPVATLAKRHIARDRTRLLAESADHLLARMERIGARSSVDRTAAGLERSAVCQWVVDLTYRIMRCAYVGIAQTRDRAQSPSPLAEAGRLVPDRHEWWERLQNALFAERREHMADDAQPTEAPLLVRLPPRKTAPARHAQRCPTVCAIPIHVGGELTAIFAVEAKGSAPVLSAELISLARAMASTVAITLEAVAHRLTQGKQETKALRSAVREMDGALSLVSHELKSPLTTIMGSLQLVRPQVERLARLDPCSPETEKTLAAVQDRLAMASRSAEIEDRLATDLVNASRIRSAKLTLRPRLDDLGQIVRDSVGSQCAELSRRIHLEVPDHDIPVFADPDRIEQVITNFLGNALKYSPKDTPVEVRVKVLKTTWAQVSVRDYGPGLEKPELKRVWRRFYRVREVPVHSATGSGLGLGLYIGREIIRGHGGKVGVKSIAGHGATFWFTLPLAATE